MFVTPGDEPPHPLDFPVKDPLQETYEGRWKQLPLVQQIGVTVVLGFWCLFIAVMVWGDGRPPFLNRLLPFLFGAMILGALLILLRKIIR